MNLILNPLERSVCQSIRRTWFICVFICEIMARIWGSKGFQFCIYTHTRARACTRTQRHAHTQTCLNGALKRTDAFCPDETLDFILADNKIPVSYKTSRLLPQHTHV